MFKVRNRLAALALALAGSGAFAIAPQAQAADIDTGVTCALGTWSVGFSPGALLLTPHNVTATTQLDLTGCVALSDLALTSGTAENVQTINNFTCLNLLAPVSATWVIDWNTGQTSTVTFTNEIVGVTVAETGTVTAGLFAGQTYAAALQSFPIQLPQACLTSGLSLINGAAVADIT